MSITVVELVVPVINTIDNIMKGDLFYFIPSLAFQIIGSSTIIGSRVVGTVMIRYISI